MFKPIKTNISEVEALFVVFLVLELERNAYVMEIVAEPFSIYGSIYSAEFLFLNIKTNFL